MCFGFGTTFKNIVIDVRYTVDMIDIYNENMQDPWGKQKSESLSFLFGHEF